MSNKMRPKGRVVRQPPTSIQRAVGRPTKTPATLAELGAKIVGKHRWAAIATYGITEQQANAATTGGAINLDAKKIVEFVVGCWDCQVDYQQCHNQPCAT